MFFYLPDGNRKGVAWNCPVDRFINASVRGASFEAKKNRIHVSRIFKWFKKNFNTTDKTADNPIMVYLSSYFHGDGFTKEVTKESDIHQSYLHYDWHLNEMVKPPDSAGE